MTLPMICTVGNRNNLLTIIHSNHQRCQPMLMLMKVEGRGNSVCVSAKDRTGKDCMVNYDNKSFDPSVLSDGGYIIADVTKGRMRATLVSSDAAKCVYMLIIYQEDKPLPIRLIKFIDQDIMFTWFCEQYGLIDAPFIWNDRTISFADDKKTRLDFSVHEVGDVAHGSSPQK